LSIIARIKNGSFKTLHVPYDHANDYLTNEATVEVNASTDMGKIKTLTTVVVPNINFDILNILFCLCLSGPPLYKPTADNLDYISTINWIKEDQISMKDFLYEKHSIPTYKLYIMRLVTFILLLTLFNFFPTILYLIYSITLRYSVEQIDADFLTHGVFLSLCLVITVVIFTKISYRAIHCFNMSFCLGLLLLTIFLILKQIF
jgi:hypothetical protein